MSEFKVFTYDEMSNDEYHDPENWTAEYVSGSSLAEIFATCPAAWKFKKREETKALAFGTQSHTNFQSKKLFEAEYMRGVSPDQYENLITSQTALAAHMKKLGISGTSGKGYPELLAIAHKSGLNLNVLWLEEMIAESVARSEGKTLVDPVDYDACMEMRSVLEAIPEHNACMNSETAQRELSIFGTINGVKVKVRLDHVDVVGDHIVITDYKTTMSANPGKFSKLAFDHGYYLKMALQHDLFKKAYPEEKRKIIVRLLAQEKKQPYLPLAFTMGEEILKIGRIQYMSVINQFAECQKHNVWPSYLNGEVECELEIPQWVRKQYEQFL